MTRSYPREEQWRSIPGWEGLYEASSHGRIRGMNRVIIAADGSRRTIRGRVLKSDLTNGYLAYRLGRDGKHHFRYGHRLVLEAFVGPAPEGSIACHNDGSRTNNNIDNLRWGTMSENSYDAIDHGTHASAAKTHCLRGHALSGPNLQPYSLKRGVRRCLACIKGRVFADRHGQRDRLQEISDRYYSELIAQ